MYVYMQKDVYLYVEKYRYFSKDIEDMTDSRWDICIADLL